MPGFEAVSAHPAPAKTPSVCFHARGACRGMVQSKVTQGWHWGPRSAAWICRGEPDPRLVLPQFPSWHAGEAIHLPRLPYSSVSWLNAFLSSLGPLVPGSSGRDIKIASAGKAGALGWPKKFGGWALGAQPHGSRKAAATECQAAAVCKGKLESKRCTQSLK